MTQPTPTRRPARWRTAALTAVVAAMLSLATAMLLGNPATTVTVPANAGDVRAAAGATPPAAPAALPAGADTALSFPALSPDVRPRTGHQDPPSGQELWTNSNKAGGLPAWRWGSIDLDVDTSGRFGSGQLKQIPVTIAEMGFNLSNLLWRVLLGVLQLGFESDNMIEWGAQSINAGAAFMAQRMFLFGVLFAAIVGWRFARGFIQLKSGNPFNLLRTAAVFVLAFGLLAMVSTRSNEAYTQHKGDRNAQLRYPGTLPWAASNVLNLADKVTLPLAGPILGTSGGNGPRTPTADETISGADLAARPDGATSTSGVTTCAAYMDAINQVYVNSPGAERTLVVVSRLWESTFYDSWRNAAFGYPVVYKMPDGTIYRSDIPERVMCHFAESVNDVSAEDQQKIARWAYGVGAVPTGAAPTVFGPFDTTTEKERRKAMGAWAACRWSDGGWVGQPEFNGAGSDSGSANPYNELCAKVMAGQEKFDDRFYLFAGEGKDATSKGDAAHREQLKAARSYTTAYSGGNPGGRVVYSLLSVVIALIFLYVFGMLGLGLVLAMLIAVSFLAIGIPVALALLAVGKTRQAVPLFKGTLFSLLSHAFLTILLSVVILISGLFRALLGNFDEMPLILSALVNGLAPVAAVVIVRKTMKSMGMADILSPSGALSFGASAALTGTGNKQMSGAAKSLAAGNALKKTPYLGEKLTKADRYTPTLKNWNEEGRERRRAEAAKEDKFKKERLEKRIEQRKNRPDGPMNRLRNRVDSARIPGTLRGRLRDTLAGIDRHRGGPGARGAQGAGAAAVAGMLLGGPVGAAVVGGTFAASSLVRRRRRVGDKVDEEAALLAEPPVEYLGGEVHGNGTAVARRSESGQQLADHVDANKERLGKDLALSHPELGDAQRLEMALEEIAEGLIRRFAENVTTTTGLLSTSQIESLRISAGAKLGYEPTDIIATVNGIALPVPFTRDRAREELTVEQLRDFVHWLPEHEKKPQTVTDVAADGRVQTRLETMDEVGARLLAIGMARGLVNPDGSTVDVLDLKGINIESEEGRERVIAWQSGKADETLDRLEIGALNDALEAQIVLAAQRVNARQVTVVETTELRETIRAAEQSAPRSADPEQSNRETAEIANATSQLLVAVNASRELLEKARSGGDAAAVTAAAQKVTATMERLEANQAKLLEQLGEAMVTNLERQIAAQELRDTNFANTLEASFEEGISLIEGQLERVNRVMEDFTRGSVNLADVVVSLKSVVADTQAATTSSTRQLKEALAEHERSLQQGNVRGGQASWSQPNSREVARANGLDPVPEEGS